MSGMCLDASGVFVASTLHVEMGRIIGESIRSEHLGIFTILGVLLPPLRGKCTFEKRTQNENRKAKKTLKFWAFRLQLGIGLNKNAEIWSFLFYFRCVGGDMGALCGAICFFTGSTKVSWPGRPILRFFIFWMSGCPENTMAKLPDMIGLHCNGFDRLCSTCPLEAHSILVTSIIKQHLNPVFRPRVNKPYFLAPEPFNTGRGCV